jgi:hypothetical protein
MLEEKELIYHWIKKGQSTEEHWNFYTRKKTGFSRPFPTPSRFLGKAKAENPRTGPFSTRFQRNPNSTTFI